jgi:signal transduction histidine kinase
VAEAERTGLDRLPVNHTLIRVVLLMRLLGWVWLIILAGAVLMAGDVGSDGEVLVGTIVLATAGTTLTYVAVRRRFLENAWYVILDAVIALALAMAGWVAGFDEFLVGGYPVSWLFIVAYASNMRLTAIAGIAASIVFAFLHVAMGLDQTRVLGSIQFVVVALVVGWAFDSLRDRDRLRIAAEAEAAEAERELSEERDRSARLEERSALARQLHDSVLQTLKLISSSAEDAAEVRYLTRVQERDLRRTINEYRSPYEDSFKARLLDIRAEVEDRYRVQIEQVVNDDAEMDDRLRAIVSASAEAMNNAARHSGVKNIDLFAQIRDGRVEVNVRDRGSGFDPNTGGMGINQSIKERVASVGGTVEIRSAPGRGTEVRIVVPLQ